MKVTTKVIADALDRTKRAIEKRGEREGWPFELMAVRGGRCKVFDLKKLPVAVAHAVKMHQLASTGHLNLKEGDGLAFKFDIESESHRYSVSVVVEVYRRSKTSKKEAT